MRNAIIQMIIGEGYAEQPLTASSIKSVKEYCERIGAEYIQYTGPRNYGQVTAEKMNVFQEQFDEYDSILVLDADIIVTEVAPDVFSEYGRYDISGMPCSGESVGAHHTFTKRPSGGTLMYSKEARKKIREWLKDYNMGGGHCADEDAIHKASQDLGIHMVCRDQRYDNYPPREGIRKDFYFIHFVGNCRDRFWREDEWSR